MLGCCFVVVNRLLFVMFKPTTAEFREISEMQRLNDIPTSRVSKPFSEGRAGKPP